MRAVGYRKSLPVDDCGSAVRFRDRQAGTAAAATSVSPSRPSRPIPLDYKVRKRAAPPEGETKILGYDAAGIVDAIGLDVTLFKAGDEVFYAGSIQRQGTNSEFHLVDERIVGRKPAPFVRAGSGATADLDHRLGIAV